MIESHVKNLTDNEIAQMLSILMNEKEERRAEKQKKAWNEIQEAILNYISEFGEIVISDFNERVNIGVNADFSYWGEISDPTGGW